MWYLYLSETPRSHLLTALSDTYSVAASSFWVHPLFSAQLCQKAAKCSLIQFVHIFCLLAGVCRPFLALLYRAAPSRATDAQ